MATTKHDNINNIIMRVHMCIMRRITRARYRLNARFILPSAQRM